MIKYRFTFFSRFTDWEKEISVLASSVADGLRRCVKKLGYDGFYPDYSHNLLCGDFYKRNETGISFAHGSGSLLYVVEDLTAGKIYRFFSDFN